jgi:2-dehydro-3-deoxyphosphogluconate aldolase/(4S)-4-hydroxy-2-oxoglutarate aldolase
MSKEETLNRIRELGLLAVLRSPFPHIPLMPTGGINIDNIPDWFKAGAFAVGAGSQLCPKNLVNKGDFAAVSNIAAEFMKAVEGAQPQSV